MADRLGGHLVGRNAGVDVGAGFAARWVDPGQEARGGAGVVAGAGAEGSWRYERSRPERTSVCRGTAPEA